VTGQTHAEQGRDRPRRHLTPAGAGAQLVPVRTLPAPGPGPGAGRPGRPRYLALLDQILGRLAGGGVSADRAAWAVDLLLQLATATGAGQGSRGKSTPPDADHAPRAAVPGSVGSGHPHIAAVTSELFSGTGPARLDCGIRVLTNGVLVTPRPE
jgi:hypothetical protein